MLAVHITSIQEGFEPRKLLSKLLDRASMSLCVPHQADRNSIIPGSH